MIFKWHYAEDMADEIYASVLLADATYGTGVPFVDLTIELCVSYNGETTVTAWVLCQEDTICNIWMEKAITPSELTERGALSVVEDIALKIEQAAIGYDSAEWHPVDKFVKDILAQYIEDEPSDDDVAVGDNYHTMSELYDHRNLLFANLVRSNNLGYSFKTKWEDKETKCEDDWFLLGLNSEYGQIIYHLPMSMWDAVEVEDIGREWLRDGKRKVAYEGNTPGGTLDILKAMLEKQEVTP